MNLTLSVLGSGSKGNASLLASSTTRLLIDVGFSRRQLRERLKAVGAKPEDLTAAIVTHSHVDHVCESGLKMCCELHLPLYCHSVNVPALLNAVSGFATLKQKGLIRLFGQERFIVGDFAVRCFELPHDAPQCNVGLNVFHSTNGRELKISIATDLGHMPRESLPCFADSDLIMLESNHDVDMLMNSDRPQDLKERIRGHRGHLSNAQAAEALVAIASQTRPGVLRRVVLAHLSQECNECDLATRTVRRLLSEHGFGDVAVELTHQDRPSVFELTS